MSDNRSSKFRGAVAVGASLPRRTSVVNRIAGLFCNDVLWTFDGNAASRHLPHSSSASRLTAGASGFLNFSQSGERPDR